MNNTQELVNCATDFKYFVDNYVKIVHPNYGQISINSGNCLEYMEKLLTNNEIIVPIESYDEINLVLAYILWYGMFHQYKTIMIVSYNQIIAKNILSSIKVMYESLPDNIKFKKLSIDNKTELGFDNGTKILASVADANTTRGIALSILYCYGLEYMKEKRRNQFSKAIWPTVTSTGTKLILASSHEFKKRTP